MENRPKIKYESTIPEWVRNWSGTGEGETQRFQRMNSLREIAYTVFLLLFLAIVTLVVFFILYFVLEGLFRLLGTEGSQVDVESFLKITIHAYVLLSGVALIYHWTQCVRAVRWLRREWVALTSAPLPTSIQEAAKALEGLTDQPEKFHRARDIAAWFGQCDPQLRPRQVANFSKRWDGLLSESEEVVE